MKMFNDNVIINENINIIMFSFIYQGHIKGISRFLKGGDDDVDTNFSDGKTNHDYQKRLNVRTRGITDTDGKL